MSPLYDLILQLKGELHTETVQVADAAQAWRLGRERYPHCIRGVVCRMRGVMALQLSHPNAAKKRHPNSLGWSCGSSRAR